MILKPIAEDLINSKEFAALPLSSDSSSFASVEGIGESAFPFIIASAFYKTGGRYLCVTETSQKMQELYTDLTCLLAEDNVFMMPSWETLPYEPVRIPDQTDRERVASIYKILSGEPAVFVSTAEALIRKMPAADFFLRKGLVLQTGKSYPFSSITTTLASYGYSREDMTQTPGEFSVKGGIVDVFMPAKDNPVRLDFFGDTLEGIREFDPVSQMSVGGLESVTIYPRRELLLLPREREKLAAELEAIGGQLFPEDSPYDDVLGIQDLFTLKVSSASLLTLFNGDVKVVLCEPADIEAKIGKIKDMFSELYSRKHKQSFCLSPEQLLDSQAYEEASRRALRLQSLASSPNALFLGMKTLPGFQGRIKILREDLERRIDGGWRVVISTSFEGQARRLADLFAAFNPNADFAKTGSDSLSIIVSPYKGGVEMTEMKTLILTDQEVFGKSYKRKKQFGQKSSRPISSFLELNPGDYVVHINSGIGIFRKIERMTAGGIERDFILIEYADGDKLYVSLDQINMVQKYIGLDGRVPRIDALGRKSAWNKIKERVQASVDEIAGELINIYSKRSALKGFRYPPDTLWQEEFEALFEFEETPDQITAIEDVKDDMEKDKPMDRLVCGDVGFGKTEVAIRAAFKAVMAGRQVAVLVPTTILALQHFNTFTKRFADYPIRIEMMSRFKTRSQLTACKKSLAAGEVDIVIGTHALLAADVRIKNLGLLIVDEEQKFGVKHKEHIKKLKETIDVLTLSATPIPRTLHLSMAGMRDLSVIVTPPENRQAIETYVLEDNPEILRAAIKNELDRDGQVFYVHNRINTIEAQAQMLAELAPEAAICVAHGQMDEQVLEDIMIDFIEHKYDILVSTTIVESGLDMPNVNTIIINRADTFGLSQLYQLKGRVGRSARKSYAYLFYPRHIALTEEASKRLKVISEYSELGSGFRIAMKDLEIRGAGNILGKEQSGSIMEVGFELYCQMLDDAVKKLNGEKPSVPFRTPVFINTDFFLPEDYISDQRQKIEFYKRLEACESLDEVFVVESEMHDRFGKLPAQAKVLIAMEEIRVLASALFIDEISQHGERVHIRISGQSLIEPSKLLELIAKDKRFIVDPADNEMLVFNIGKANVENLLAELKKWLQQISPVATLSKQ